MKASLWCVHLHLQLYSVAAHTHKLMRTHISLPKKSSALERRVQGVPVKRRAGLALGLPGAAQLLQRVELEVLLVRKRVWGKGGEGRGAMPGEYT